LTTTEHEHQQPTTDPTIKVRRDLAEVLDLDVQLLTQAVHDANAQIDGTSLPGGRAMIALASVGDVESFERRVEFAEAAWMAQAVREGGVRIVDGVTVVLDDSDRPDPAAEEDDDDAPALQIIRYWSEKYRWELSMLWDHTPTIQTEAAFLRNPQVLAHVTEHHADDWAHMARDINRARLHLESILHAGRRPDRSRVVCNNPACTDQKELIRVHSRPYIAAAVCVGCATTLPETRQCADCSRPADPSDHTRCRREIGKKDQRHVCGGELISTTEYDHCPNPWCFTTAPPEIILTSDEDADRWKCTGCKKHYDDEAYAAAYAAMLRDQGAERFVTLAEAVSILVKQGRPEVTVRSWLKPPRRHVSDRCRDCKRDWSPGKHATCEGVSDDTGEVCGGKLWPKLRGNAEDVIEAYCDLATRRTLVWWPDIWRRHLVKKDKAERAKRRRTEDAASA